LLQFRPSEANHRRISERIAGQHDGTLSAEEASEPDDFSLPKNGSVRISLTLTSVRPRNIEQAGASAYRT
jgi:hypothetical protein